MSARQYNKYLWLLNVIHAAGHITFKDIEDKWVHASINERKESRLPRSTFNAMKAQIEELMNVNIVCDRHTNEYYIENADLLPAVNNGYLTHYAIAQLDMVCVKPLPIQRVCLHVIVEAAPHLRIYPLHKSQHEVEHEQSNKFAIFEYLISPTMEFYQKVRSMGTDVELVEPEWLRHHLREDARIMYATYVDGYSIKKEAEGEEYVEQNS